MENYAMTNFEEMVADEMFPETSNTYDSENFPIKDRKHASSRRKRNYLVGKRRFTRFSNEWGLSWIINNQPVLRGIMRKTNVRNPFKEDDTRLNSRRANVRRQETSNDKLREFVTEGV